MIESRIRAPVNAIHQASSYSRFLIFLLTNFGRFPAGCVVLIFDSVNLGMSANSIIMSWELGLGVVITLRVHKLSRDGVIGGIGCWKGDVEFIVRVRTVDINLNSRNWFTVYLSL